MLCTYCRNIHGSVRGFMIGPVGASLAVIAWSVTRGRQGVVPLHFRISVSNSITISLWQ